MKKYLCVLFGFILLVSLSACNHSPVFSGSRTGNESQFIMEYSMFNTSDAQSLELEKGDIIDAQIVNKAGNISITIQKDGEKPIYEGENIPTSRFQVEIIEKGTYKIKVTGKKAKGSLSFIKSTHD